MRPARSGVRFRWPRSLLWRAGIALIAVQAIGGGVILLWRPSGAVLASVVVGAILPSIVIVRLASRRMRRHIEGLVGDIARLGAGDLTHRTRSSRPQELAEIARALNDMARELQQRLHEIAARQEEFRTILQSMTSGVVALDEEARILTLNHAAEVLLGVSAPDARGRLLHEVVRQPELHRLVAFALSGMGQGPGAGPLEFTLADPARAAGRPGQATTRLEARVEPMQSGSGGLVILLNDVTRLRRLEALRSDFAANVSHELRTPITNIKGYIETLLETGLDDRAQAQRFLAVIRHNSDRLAAIVDDVLALTRLERPRTGEEFPKEPASIRGILAAAIGQHRVAAESKSIAVELSAEAGLMARVHPPLLEQAVGNLISNAINYAPPGTTVKVSARGHAVDTTVTANESPPGRGELAEIEIVVADQGPGIAPEHHERIFERFYRVDRGRGRSGGAGGTGLGLAIVKHIVREHRGGVSLESEVGRGSTFRIVIPANPA